MGELTKTRGELTKPQVKLFKENRQFYAQSLGIYDPLSIWAKKEVPECII